MDRQSTQDLYFYSPKGKNLMISILLLGFTVLGIIICIDGFTYENTSNVLIGGITVLISSPLVLLFSVRGILTSKPFAIITHKELTFNATTKNPTVIQRIDIKGYEIKSIHLNDFVELDLHNEETYRAQMSHMNKKLNELFSTRTNDSPFIISLNQIKTKERQTFLDALDKEPIIEAADQPAPMEIYEEAQPALEHFTGTYLWSAYVYSAILTALASFYVYWEGLTKISWWYIAATLILFPFAKMIYDRFIGFTFNEKLKRQVSLPRVMYQLRVIIYILVYMCSILIVLVVSLYFIGRKIISKLRGLY